MTWLGVGNVEGRVLSGDPSITRPKGSLALGRGVPGHALPTVRSARLAVDWGDVLVLATDGIESTFADSLDTLRLDSGDQRPHLGHPLQTPRRRPRRGGPLPRTPAVSPSSSSGAERFGTAYASALDDYLRDPTETTLRVAYELGREAVSRQLERARPRHHPSRGRVGGPRRDPRRGGSAGRRARGGRLLPGEPLQLRDGPARIPGGPRRPSSCSAAKPSSHVNYPRFSPTHPSPSTPPTHSRRYSASWPSRHASSSAQSAAWPPSGLKAAHGSPKEHPTRRPIGAGRRSCGGSTCPRSTGSCNSAVARRESPASNSPAFRCFTPRPATRRSTDGSPCR